MNRIDYLDRARAIGMFLVYYGHFLGSLATSSTSLASIQWKLIYSFHVPLFFFLTGVFWKPDPVFQRVVSEKIKTRILPVITFSLLLVPFWLLFAPGEFSKMLSLSGWYLRGIPTINLVTWFLICLFTVELLAALTARFLKMTTLRILFCATVLFVVGFYAFVWNLSTLDGWLGLLPNILQLDNAFVVMVFFFAGYLLRTPLLRAGDRSGWVASLPILFATGYLLWYTFDANLEAGRGVLVVASNYGNPLLFLFTAFAGIFFVLSLSRLLALDFSSLTFVGQNSLIYLGLNGLCFHFLDGYVIKTLPVNLESHLEILLYGSVYVILVMLMFAPVVVVLRRWFPQLVGLPWSSTSFLPPLETLPVLEAWRAKA
jgi:acyltransferase